MKFLQKFSSTKAKLGAIATGLTLGASSAMADAVDVDLSDATTSITNAGTAMIGLAVVMLGLSIVYSFLRKRG